jgi:hypothetical protein
MIYVIIYQALVLGGTGYAVFGLGHSGWWFLLAYFLSTEMPKPQGWK